MNPSHTSQAKPYRERASLLLNFPLTYLTYLRQVAICLIHLVASASLLISRPTLRHARPCSWVTNVTPQALKPEP